MKKQKIKKRIKKKSNNEMEKYLLNRIKLTIKILYLIYSYYFVNYKILKIFGLFYFNFIKNNSLNELL